MTFNVFNWNRAVMAAQLSCSEKCVALVLGSFANKGEAFPSLDDVAERASVHRNTVSRNLRAVEKAGLIERTKQPNRNTRYTLLTPGLVSPPEGIRDHHQSESGFTPVVNPVSPPEGIRDHHQSETYNRSNSPEKQPSRTAQSSSSPQPPSPREEEEESGGEKIILLQGRTRQTHSTGQDSATEAAPPSVSEEQREAMRTKWRQACERTFLTHKPIPRVVLDQLCQADAEHVNGIMSRVHAGIANHCAWLSHCLRNPVPPPKEQRSWSAVGGDGIWSGGRTPRVRATIANANDGIYDRFDGPGFYTPPGLEDLMGEEAG